MSNSVTIKEYVLPDGSRKVEKETIDAKTGDKTIEITQYPPQATATSARVPGGVVDVPSQPFATAIPSGQAPAPAYNRENNGKAVAAMVCGIVGIFIFGIILGPIAICLGTAAKQEIKANPDKMKGNCQANAGISCGIVAIVIWVIFLILYLGA